MLGLDEVWWLVSPQNPLKPAEGMADYERRLEAAEKIAAANRRIHVSDAEARLGTRYTADTLSRLAYWESRRSHCNGTVLHIAYFAPLRPQGHTQHTAQCDHNNTEFHRSSPLLKTDYESLVAAVQGTSIMLDKKPKTLNANNSRRHEASRAVCCGEYQTLLNSADSQTGATITSPVARSTTEPAAVADGKACLTASGRSPVFNAF